MYGGDPGVVEHIQSLTDVKFSHNAQYLTSGSAFHSARLNVYGPPSVRAMGTLTAVAGKRWEVMCPVGGYPIAEVVWSKGGACLVAGEEKTKPGSI